MRLNSAPIMPNRSIEIHDSTLANVAISRGQAELHFSSAYIHESEGKPGVDAGSGWVQRAILRIFDAKITGVFSEFPVNLTGGEIQMGGERLDNEIPIPLHHTGAFELRLKPMWKPQNVVSFTGSGAQLELIGEPEYVEKFLPEA